MSEKKSDRGASPKPLTVYMLCARAAGRCQFRGCNKYLFQDELTLENFNNTNIAHIIASSPKGPRGNDKTSHEMSTDIDNLMLMCLDHHKLIDSNPEKYTVEILRKMKQDQERAVQESCENMYRTPTEIICFTSMIKGKIPVNISLSQAVDAIQPIHKPASPYGIEITISSVHEYRSAEFWQDVDKQLIYELSRKVDRIAEHSPEAHFSIFPIAPIPLIIKMGYLLGDKVRSDIYQKTRIPDTWKWMEIGCTNQFQITKKEIHAQITKVALIVSLTADISESRCLGAFNPDAIYAITADSIGVDSIKSLADLSAFWHAYQSVCDEIKNKYPCIQEIALFPAIPVSAAFEVGRRYMPGVYPMMKIFDECEGFFETLRIGEIR